MIFEPEPEVDPSLPFKQQMEQWLGRPVSRREFLEEIRPARCYNCGKFIGHGQSETEMIGGVTDLEPDYVNVH